jgi:molybdopterin-guanine dinucleotide biosynthesis protein A
MRSDVAVVILAGGESRRIGGGKPLKQFAGERLIDSALRNARSWSSIAAVAVRGRAQVDPVNVPIVTDEPEFGRPTGRSRFGPLLRLRFRLRIRPHDSR